MDHEFARDLANAVDMTDVNVAAGLLLERLQADRRVKKRRALMTLVAGMTLRWGLVAAMFVPGIVLMSTVN